MDGDDLKEILNIFFELANLADKSESGDNPRYLQEKASVKRKLKAQENNRALHNIIAGPTSAGKSTLINAELMLCIPDVKVELLKTAHLENTKIVTIVDCSCSNTVITKQIELIKPGGENDVEPEETFTSIEHLVADIQNDKVPTEGRRLIIKLPRTKSQGLTDEKAHLEEWDFKPLIYSTKNRHVDTLNALVNAEGEEKEQDYGDFRIVDVPGHDSPKVKMQILSLLENRYFVFIYLLDLTQPKAFGKEGREILRHLVENLQQPFPPVFIFTKWEEFKSLYENFIWRRSHAAGKTLEDMVLEYMRTAAGQIIESGLSQRPYFAAVNARSMVEDLNKPPEGVPDLEGWKAETLKQRRDFLEVHNNVLRLGSTVAEPLRVIQYLTTITRSTQEVVNCVLRNDEHSRIVTASSMSDVKQVKENIIVKYNAKVDEYFDVREWTKEGVLKYKPPNGISKDDCAISKLPHYISKNLRTYQRNHPDESSLSKAAEKIVDDVFQEYAETVETNLKKLTVENLKAFHCYVKEVSKLKDEQVLLNLIEPSLAGSLVGYGVAAAGGAAAVAGSILTIAEVFAYTGAITVGSVGIVILGSVALIGSVGYLMNNKWGLWEWESCERVVWKLVGDALKEKTNQFKKHFKDGFQKKANDWVKKIDEYRIPGGESEQIKKAQLILGNGGAIMNAMLKELDEELKASDNRWLGGDTELRNYWEKVDWTHP